MNTGSEHFPVLTSALGCSAGPGTRIAVDVDLLSPRMAACAPDWRGKLSAPEGRPRMPEATAGFATGA